MNKEIKNLKTSAVKYFNILTNNVIWLFEVPKKTENKNPRVGKIKNGRIMLSSNCAVCVGKKSRFIKEQETSDY